MLVEIACEASRKGLNVAYVFLVMALMGLGGLGVLHKVADHKRCRPAGITLFLFSWAALLISGFVLGRHGVRTLTAVPSAVVLVAVLCGTFASLAIFNFQHGVRYGKISTSWLVINLSTAVPTLLSIVIYREEIGWKRGLSLLLGVLALAFLWLDRREEERQNVALAGQKLAPLGREGEV
jgi:drug/metabolite transporter (DMT)-like permease